jgi:hypothetical protein
MSKEVSRDIARGPTAHMDRSTVVTIVGDLDIATATQLYRNLLVVPDNSMVLKNSQVRLLSAAGFSAPRLRGPPTSRSRWQPARHDRPLSPSYLPICCSPAC